MELQSVGSVFKPQQQQEQQRQKLDHDLDTRCRSEQEGLWRICMVALGIKSQQTYVSGDNAGHPTCI
jgi:hypothetical protein